MDAIAIESRLSFGISRASPTRYTNKGLTRLPGLERA